MKPFKPLLACPVEFDKLDYDNLWGSPKLDGIRALFVNGGVYSRKLIKLPNRHIQSTFSHPMFQGLDGEFIFGDPTSKTVYNETFSAVMTAEGTPSVKLYAFDFVEDEQAEYHERYVKLGENYLGHPLVEILEQVPIRSYDELLAVEARYLDMGYEGMMLRKHKGNHSRYKRGRSTPGQGTLLKLKRFSDKEALIVSVEEEMENLNEATIDETGHTKRSSHKENKKGKGRLGALVCRTDEGVVFNIGTGFSHEQREDLWRRRHELMDGVYAKYKSFDVGAIDAPRFPVFLGLRDPIDM